MSGTFDTGEIASAAGMTVRLYELTRQGVTWFYTNCESDVTFNTNIYLAYPITDNGLKQKGEAVTDAFELIVPNTNPVAQLFTGTPPADAIKVVMREMVLGDTLAPIQWLGYVVSVKIMDSIKSMITASTQGSTLRRKGLRLQYSRECPHSLYDSNCKAVPSAHGEIAIITGLSGSQFNFTISGPNPDTEAFTTRFTGGYFTFQSGPENEFVEQRGIMNHLDTAPGVGGVLVLGQTDGLAIGMTVTMYPGCKKDPFWCLNYFQNISNHGGFAFMPGRSPYDGDPVF